MEILRERVRPDRDPYFHQVTIKRLNVVVERYIHYTLGDRGGKWIIRGHELVSGEPIKFEVKEEEMSRKMLFSKEDMESIREGEVYQFIWKIMKRKVRLFRTGKERFRAGREVVVFDGFKNIDRSRTTF